MSSRLLSVALPLPIQTCLTYRVPEPMPMPERGVRVLVPFGSRKVLGVACEGAHAEPPSGTELRDVLDVLDEAPIVPLPLLDLAAWVSSHYLAPPGECYRLVFPPAGIRASRAVARLLGPAPSPSDPVTDLLRDGPLRLSTLAHRLGSDPTARLGRLRREGVVAVEQDLQAAGFKRVRVARLAHPDAAARGSAQSALLERLRLAGCAVAVADLVRERPSHREALRRLVAGGAVVIEEQRVAREPPVLPGVPANALSLSMEQDQALGPILEAVEAGEFRTFLLHGVTGSGKTEVYLRAVERAYEAGRGALLLVPEIALTPLLLRQAVARFGPVVAVLHSELSAGERHDQWWRIREAEAPIVVGARSALFAPVPNLGLVVVDEEHEAAYKQEESPRYHARDAAVMRGRIEAAPVVLGSATPSIESFTNARKGKYTLLRLSSRIGPRGLPRVEIVDRRAVIRSGGDPILTPPLQEALAERLRRKEQSLLLLNRRGYATSLLCRECGEQAACPNCSVSLVLHFGARAALCHYCGYEIPKPDRCAGCRGEYLRLAGFGTERVVEAVTAAFPEARVARLDRDAAARRGAIERILVAFEAGATDVLVGTQMIAKGHDFARVTLVGVIDADVGLGLPDFRSAERTFQLLTQVAGRSGRGEVAGEVVLQSHLPDHYALEMACAQDYEGFFDREMEFRRTMGYPPQAELLNLIVRAKDPAKGMEQAAALARSLRARAGTRYRVLGPARAPLARLRQEHRFQIVLKGQRGAMREAVKSCLVASYGDLRWPGIVPDVDPVSVM
jgi:primosomal protein N' (replication factor Y) (superfamily II helicase)